MPTSAVASRPAARWSRTGAAVLAEKHTVYALDLPGPGDSEAAPPVRYAHLDYPTPGPALGANAPFTAQQIDEYARTHQRPQVLTGGFELYRTLDQDERDNRAAKPISMPTLLLTAEGTPDFTRSTVQPLMSGITRAVQVPRAGHGLIAENPEFVTTELVEFLARGADR